MVVLVVAMTLLCVKHSSNHIFAILVFVVIIPIKLHIPSNQQIIFMFLSDLFGWFLHQIFWQRVLTHSHIFNEWFAINLKEIKRPVLPWLSDRLNFDHFWEVNSYRMDYIVGIRVKQVVWVIPNKQSVKNLIVKELVGFKDLSDLYLREFRLICIVFIGDLNWGYRLLQNLESRYF